MVQMNYIARIALFTSIGLILGAVIRCAAGVYAAVVFMDEAKQLGEWFARCKGGDFCGIYEIDDFLMMSILLFALFGALSFGVIAVLREKGRGLRDQGRRACSKGRDQVTLKKH